MIFNTGGTGHGASWLTGAFLLPVAYIAYTFIGFEASASIGEEVKESRRVLPKAIMLCLVVGGILVILASLGLVLAIPDMAAAVSGKDANPIATTLETSYGSGAGRTLLIALVIGFASSMIAVQTAVTRAIWASARDRLLPGNRVLGQLSGREHLPRYAIGLTVVIAGALLFAGTTIVAGTAVALVTAVGADTQARRAAELASGEVPDVGLQHQLSKLTNQAFPVSTGGGEVGRAHV